MFPTIAERLRQKYRTVPYPAQAPVLPPRFRGRPNLHADTPAELVTAALDACPTGALCAGTLKTEGLSLDMGRCIFCGACEKASSGRAVTFSSDHALAAFSREALVLTTASNGPAPAALEAEAAAQEAAAALRAMFRRSLRIRQVSAAGCNACEADCNVLTTVVFDLARFGIDFVASPRHADAVLVTGPVPMNMQRALITCYEAMPSPKIVIATGACAISGGLFAELSPDNRGACPHLKVDLFIPGCPPSPYTILHGLLLFLQREQG